MSVLRRIRPPAAGVLFLLSVLGLGAEEQDPNPRAIIGGQPAAVEDYPFVVNVTSWLSGCTGSLIAPSWVLTAAHCFPRDKVYTTLVDHNTDKIYGQENGYPRLRRKAKQNIPHPRFKSIWGYNVNDIALIELEKPFPADYSASLKIPTLAVEKRHADWEETLPADYASFLRRFFYARSSSAPSPWWKSATFLGYGDTEESPRTPRKGILHAAHMTALDGKYCGQQFHRYYMNGDYICSTGYLTTHRRPGSADSGGPLVVAYTEDGNTKYMQIGVASQITAVSGPSISIFARVSSYANWIQATTSNAVIPIDLVLPSDFETADAKQILSQLRRTEGQIHSLQNTAQSLQSNRDKLKGLIDQMKDVDGQDKTLQAETDEILRSASKILPLPPPDTEASRQ